VERVSPPCPLVESGAELSQREAALRLRLNRGMGPSAGLDSSQARTDQVPSSPRPSIAVAGPTKLRVTAAEADHMPLYLRASRDDRSDRTHARLPADIFSTSVQLGARGEIVESLAAPRSLFLVSSLDQCLA
jgi:hypothetical protein